MLEAHDIFKRVHLLQGDTKEFFSKQRTPYDWVEDSSGEFVQIQYIVSIRNYVPFTEPTEVFA